MIPALRALRPRLARRYASTASTVIADLRSDTVTQPTDEMRDVMARAPVGDDVFGEDPSVSALEQRAAALLGKESALFVPSGSMGNLLCLYAQVPRGAALLAGHKSHVHLYEAGSPAVVLGAQCIQVDNDPDGTLPLGALADAITADDPHCAPTALVAIENTQNNCGGRVLPLAYVDAVGAFCRARGLRCHVDGARLLNAAVASGVGPARLVEGADTVSLCLSKGLGAPVGSVVAGDARAVAAARRARKLLGGGMRQCGILAAAGLHALGDGSAAAGGVDGGPWADALARDHALARRLARGAVAAGRGAVSVVTDAVSPASAATATADPAAAAAAVDTNIVYLDVEGAGDVDGRGTGLVEALAARGVRLSPGAVVVAGGSETTRFRAVLHRDVGGEDAVDAVVAALGEVMQGRPE